MLRPSRALLAAALSLPLCMPSLTAQAPAAAPAKPQPPTFQEALAAQRREIRLENGHLAGPGAERLLADARAARFVLLGEDHGMAETAQIAAALFRDLEPSGFDTYAGEWGPVGARLLTAAARDPRGLAACDEIHIRHPLSIAFSTYREEQELYRTVATTSRRADPLWGLDQEFIFAPGLLFDRLATRTKGSTQQALRALVEREDEAYRQIVAQKNPSAGVMFMNQPLPESWKRLRQALQNDREAVATFDALEASREIYGHYFAGRYDDNNQVRATYMKGTLRRAFAGHEADRKLLVKLGANHVRRGFSPIGVQDVGNLLSELALYQGGTSLHILILTLAGTQNAWFPFTPPEAKSTPLDAKGDDYAEFRPLVDALPAAETMHGWTYYDLRPLRQGLAGWHKDHPDLEGLLRGFDAVLVVDQAHAATLTPSLEAAAK